MTNDNSVIGTSKDLVPGEDALFQRVSEIIESRKSRAASAANSEVTMMFWEVGHYINSYILDGERAAYGEEIVATLSPQLVRCYGSSFGLTNIRRMMRFAKRIPNAEIVATLSPQLSWSHFVSLLPLKSDEAFTYYAHDAIKRNLSVRELRHQIDRKAYERHEIANANLTDESSIPHNVFKDPYLLDILGLRDNYDEADLETAILAELEAFILEFGHGITFVARQKRMTAFGNDYYPNLIFYSRDLKRLIVVELKIGKFKPEYKGQMEMYLKLLDKYERRDDENESIGLILCASAGRETVELMEMDKAGIAVAEYWTQLPPKEMLENKVTELLIEVKERMERRKTLPTASLPREIKYYYEPKDDVED
jgi:predicted nuclease of restriction endonuclease-like (RecB) superfamily